MAYFFRQTNLSLGSIVGLILFDEGTFIPEHLDNMTVWTIF